MADKNSSKNNFIMQAGILAAAGIISRIIGLLYRGPLQSVIGNLGKLRGGMCGSHESHQGNAGLCCDTAHLQAFKPYYQNRS